ncbi:MULTISPECIES: UDP-N-acetylmuramoyl-L-alanine--D-glutamate ligase [Alteriqipengyuania]|uniref:UDP-N-acetylmuramoylalanine--D-glutamate ligase n=1 Tax=Alteriqipengyuania abyssalis TaxID=2860200 RepID=A0ABS7PE85_9SPHN|nr:UDP-N-acetylmuramoyl-L-alanine--D-glutamate ligase [Alteriqipengyuania lutimaris]MBY8337398.1 UDP-N-acetylmuramoyl-L-alanine--D-glutamate ligase [Alteriqipengyuania abyssalis]
MILSPAWKGRKYAVLGLARTGRATVEALLAAGAEVTAWDSREDAREAFAGRVTLADPVETDLTGFEAVLVTPGVPLNTHPIKPHADKFGVPVIGDIELFAQAREHLPPHKVVGITGTNGKSTTTALTHHILKTAGVPTTMGGNIGLPILGQEPLPEGGVYVLELSSYQIDLTYSLDCDVAVLLNVTPDHLDRYESFEAYAAAKARLFEMNTIREDWGRVIVVDDPMAATIASRTDCVFDVGSKWLANQDPSHLSLQLHWPTLQGPHNAQNAAAAIQTCRSLGLDWTDINRGLRTFPGLPHRMERVGERAGVLYVNDSKATNTAAAAPALAAFEKIHWIVGGQAKEPGLGETEQHIGHVTAAYTIGEAGDAFADALAPHCPVSRCGTLDIAVHTAALAAKPGETVLLSPACASFDQFRDFEDRGDRFRALVHALADSEATP